MPDPSSKKKQVATSKVQVGDEVPGFGKVIAVYEFEGFTSRDSKRAFESPDPIHFSLGESSRVRYDYFGPLPWLKYPGEMEGLRQFYEEHPELLEELLAKHEAQEVSHYQPPTPPEEKPASPPRLWPVPPSDQVH